MRTLMCPLCGSRWNVELNGTRTSEVVWQTCDPCFEGLPQHPLHADDPEEDCTDGNDA